MPFTKKKKGKKNTSVKNGKHRVSKFEEEITSFFLELVILIKLYHWNTPSYAAHKASDELYDTLNKHMDKFMEVLFGKINRRLTFKNQTIKLSNISSKKEIISIIHKSKSYLVNLNKNRFLSQMSNPDLFNIRDEILSDLNQFLYLLTFE